MVDKCKEMFYFYSKEQDRKFSIYPKFSVRSCEFAYNNKRGAKKGSAYSKAKAALVMVDE